jgi:glycosyltransferase involved in cell wall biosynthesis
MRLAVVAPNILLPGTHGGSTHVTELVRALRTRHEVLAIARRRSTAPGTVPIGLGSGTGAGGYALAALHYPLSLAALLRFRPQAIYERFSASGLGVMLGKTLGVPVVSMVLDPHANRLTLELADRLITTHPALVPEQYHHKLVKVQWGANCDHFRPNIDAAELRRTLGYGPDVTVFGYAGAFYSWHGLEELVEAVRLMDPQRERRGCRFLLVGCGQKRPEIEQRVRDAGLSEQFHFVGRVPYEEVPRYLAACDAAVSPYNPSRNPDTHAHGMFFDPLKVFESLACGLPTVTLDAPNMRALFVHGEHALLVPPGDPVALRDALLRVAADLPAARAMGARGAELVRAKYSWCSHAQQLSQIFEELVAARASECL